VLIWTAILCEAVDTFTSLMFANDWVILAIVTLFMYSLVWIGIWIRLSEKYWSSIVDAWERGKRLAEKIHKKSTIIR